MSKRTILHEDWEFLALVETWDEKHKKWIGKCFKYFKFDDKENAIKWLKPYKNKRNPIHRTTLDLMYIGGSK